MTIDYLGPDDPADPRTGSTVVCVGCSAVEDYSRARRLLGWREAFNGACELIGWYCQPCLVEIDGPSRADVRAAMQAGAAPPA
jgi:hypothetical protein